MTQSRFSYHCSAIHHEEEKATTPLFLHLGPSGDCWTGSSIFAAKHLQPDYVKSIPLPDDIACVETLLEVMEENSKMAQDAYDSAVLPEEVLVKVKERMKEKEQEGG